MTYPPADAGGTDLILTATLLNLDVRQTWKRKLRIALASVLLLVLCCGIWEAAADFEAAAALDPKIENIQYLIGHAHRVALNYDRARIYLEQLIAAQPDHADALAVLGFIAIEQDRLNDAESLLNRAIAIAPDDVSALYDYARLTIKRRDYQEAVRVLGRVVAKYPTHAEAHYQLMLAYSHLKQADKAKAALAEFKRLHVLEKQVFDERRWNEKLRAQQMVDQPQ